MNGLHLENQIQEGKNLTPNLNRSKNNANDQDYVIPLKNQNLGRT